MGLSTHSLFSCIMLQKGTYSNALHIYMKNYSVTFAGLAVIILGMLGVTDIALENEITTVIDYVIQIIGIAVAWYGRYKAGGVNVLGFRK